MTDSVDNQDDQIIDDELAKLPPERLAQMLRDKRKAEATVRGKLRDTETERDTLAGTVSSFQKGKLHELAKAGGVLESALPDLDTHLKPEEMLGEDGTIDSEKVTAALAELKTERPHYFPQISHTSGSPSYGHTGAIYNGQATSWGDVLSG